MTQQRLTDAEMEQVGFICHYCDAEPGMWCTTKTGRGSAYLHSDRYYQWRDQVEIAHQRLAASREQARNETDLDRPTGEELADGDEREEEMRDGG